MQQSRKFMLKKYTCVMFDNFSFIGQVIIFPDCNFWRSAVMLGIGLGQNWMVWKFFVTPKLTVLLYTVLLSTYCVSHGIILPIWKLGQQLTTFKLNFGSLIRNNKPLDKNNGVLWNTSCPNAKVTCQTYRFLTKSVP